MRDGGLTKFGGAPEGFSISGTVLRSVPGGIWDAMLKMCDARLAGLKKNAGVSSSWRRPARPLGGVFFSQNPEDRTGQG